MKQSNLVRRIWCVSWLGFTLFSYFTLYQSLEKLSHQLNLKVPILSTISMYSALASLIVLTLSPPYNKPPSQKITTFYIIGAIVISLGIGLFMMVIPFLFSIYNI